MTRLALLVIPAALTYALVCGLLAHLFTQTQRRRTWPLRATPGDIGLPYEDIAFSTKDRIRISGWWLEADGSTAVVLLAGGGLNRLNDDNANPATNRSSLDLARGLIARGHSVLMYDSRGTGASGGDRISYGSLESRDLEAALAFLRTRGIEPYRVAILAWSMGCATAMFTLESQAYAGLIADSPLGGFSTDDVVRYASRALQLPSLFTRPLVLLFINGVFVVARVLWGMRLDEQPQASLRKHPVQTVVIHGRADRQIPLHVAEQAALAAGPSLIASYYLDGVDHCGAMSADPGWYLTIVSDALDVMFGRNQ